MVRRKLQDIARWNEKNSEKFARLPNRTVNNVMLNLEKKELKRLRKDLADALLLKQSDEKRKI